MPLIERADVSSCWSIRESDAVADAAGKDTDLVVTDEEVAEFGLDV